MIPFPDPIAVAAIAALPALAEVNGRVSTELSPTGQLPAVRVTKVRDLEAPSTWETTPIYQVEIWASDALDAGRIAWAVRNTWPTATKAVVGEALVTARWVDTNPTSLPDPETGLPRCLFTVGLRLTGVPS